MSFLLLLEPTSPQFVNVDATSSMRLNVSWQPPKAANGVILSYIIYYQRVGSDEQYSIVATSTERNKIIKNLKPYTNYSFEVAANTSVGYGNKSDSKIGQTKQAGKPTMCMNCDIIFYFKYSRIFITRRFQIIYFCVLYNIVSSSLMTRLQAN